MDINISQFLNSTQDVDNYKLNLSNSTDSENNADENFKNYLTDVVTDSATSGENIPTEEEASILAFNILSDEELEVSDDEVMDLDENVIVDDFAFTDKIYVKEANHEEENSFNLVDFADKEVSDDGKQIDYSQSWHTEVAIEDDNSESMQPILQVANNNITKQETEQNNAIEYTEVEAQPENVEVNLARFSMVNDNQQNKQQSNKPADEGAVIDNDGVNIETFNQSDDAQYSELEFNKIEDDKSTLRKESKIEAKFAMPFNNIENRAHNNITMKIDASKNINIDDQFNTKIEYIFKNDIKSAKIALDPAELGFMEVSIEKNNSKVQINFHASSLITKDLIEANINTLRDNLQEFEGDFVDVDVNMFHKEDSEPQQHTNSDKSNINEEEEVYVREQNSLVDKFV